MDHHLDEEELPRHERELTLSTGAILGIFLGLAVLCGAFFGFGYNVGRKSAPTPLNLSDVNTDPVTAGSSPAKPPAGVLSGEETSAVPAMTAKPAHKPSPAAETHPVPLVAEDASEASPVVKPVPTHTLPVTTAPTPAPVVRQPALVAPSALSPSALSPSATAAAGTFMVQVAAVSHKEDADLLLSALRSRGYAVAARSGAGDNFIHVQVGPFHDKKEADAMRQRLLTDGYNAIVKQ